MTNTIVSVILSASTQAMVLPVCKTYTKPAGDNCNSLICQKCTDGKTQWEGFPCYHTLMSCTGATRFPVAEKYDPKFWETKGGE